MTTPPSHIDEAYKLDAGALVDLFELRLRDQTTIVRFKNNDTVTWQGVEWEGAACRLTGDKRSANEEESRPRLVLVNPAGVFNKPAREGKLERATVVRKRVLRSNLDADVNLFEQRMWYVARVPEWITNQTITLELRSMIDGPNFQLPVRMYTPPEFPTVTL
ncbi:hypothetical protein IZ6_25100 [Terrihabitans soli]|uniref:Uncharacterized protein n=1 Tax=Terrihabitans soli TaxID=708113 RepID=A0A6S6QW19_9HYPH|nr:hypothetical protein [Terrihabitans soli]BCJ91775.1 hypothetical protein IZ6_25100 [Terrihabitans soli]